MSPLSTDWLGISIRLGGDVERTPANHRWEVYEGGTNVWQNRRCLFNERGEKVLTLLSSPKSTLIDPSTALVEIANEWLYHGLGVRAILTKLRWCVPYEITGISRLDLACDFTPNARQIRQIIGLGKGALEISGKKNGCDFWSVNNEDWVPEVWKGKHIRHQMSWGHKESDVKWKLYYKSKELRDAMGGVAFDKPYIVDLWRECGLDIFNVWRLEVSVKHCNKLLFDGAPLGLQQWGDNTLAIFQSLYTSRFIVSTAGNAAKGRRAQHIPFLKVDTVRRVQCRQYDGERTSSARIALLRNLVRSTEQDEVKYDRPTLDDVVATVGGIVHRDHLERYFEGMVGIPFDTWREQTLEQAGDSSAPLQRNLLNVGKGMQPNSAFDMPTIPSG